MYTSLFAACRWHAAFALLASTLVFASPAQADPAGRIGRISLLAGNVNLYNAESGESFAAPLNQPLTSGDILSTEAGSRAEIQIGSTTVRLDSVSRLELDRIDDEQVSLYLADGRSIVKLTSADAVSEFTLETRDGRFSARRTGIYRFDTDANSSTATAYYGSLHFASSDSTVDIGAGQNAQFWQDGQTRYRFLTPPSDDFTRWSAARDQRPQASTYSRYVSPEMTGAEDLDEYGDWSETTEFGAVWFPRTVAADWAPYRSGHWSWVAPWGWTWVGAEPWGFAPFHYGRWIQQRGAWGWVPGTRIARPVYAPAMVAWIGSPAAGVSISIGSRPSVGWFPLAPHEVYVPAFRSSANYIRKVNVTHVTRIDNVDGIASNPQAAMQRTRYAHRDTPQAVTVVAPDVLTHRRAVDAKALSHGDRRALREQPLQASAPVAAPPASRNRQEHPGFTRREREQAMPATPPAQPILSQPGERLPPEVVRPASPARTAPFARRFQERPRNTEAVPQTVGQARSPRIETPAAAVQTAPVPQAAIVQHSERRMPDAARPAPPPRTESLEPRHQERQRDAEAVRQAPPPRIETPAPAVQAAPVPQAAIIQRSERPMPETARPAPPPREMARPSEAPRPEARPQPQQAERHQRQPQQDDEELRRRRKDGAERR